MYEYTSIYREITSNAGIFIFMKKDNTIRVMLGTRNIDIAKIKFGWIPGELNKMESRCNRDNGNLAVIDLVIGEGRCFNMGRLIWYKPIGVIRNEQEFNEVLKEFVEFTKNYSKIAPDFITTGLSDLAELQAKTDESIKTSMETKFNSESALGNNTISSNANSIFVGGLNI